MFDIHQKVYDEDGECDEGGCEDYCDDLMMAFAESPEGEAFEEHYGALGWPRSFLYYGITYLGTTPPEMSPRDAREILFELFPRKVSIEADRAGEIIAEMRAFWEFLGRAYQLPNAAGILKELGRDAQRRLESELSDSSNFGMAKSFFTMGRDAGFDMTTEEGMHTFAAVYNASLQVAHDGQPDDNSVGEWEVPDRPAKPPRATFNVTPEDRKQRKKLRRKQRRGAKLRRR